MGREEMNVEDLIAFMDAKMDDRKGSVNKSSGKKRKRR